jgi:hypothetical protein
VLTLRSRASALGGRELAAVFAVTAALVLACYAPLLFYGLTDVDTLMNIAAARVDGLADLPALLLSKLTGGRAGLNANFYRPTLMVLYAAVRGAFGWTPAAYHAVGIAAHIACVVLVVAFARLAALRFGLARPRSFSYWAGLAFALHPVSIEVVPAIARNGDLLMTAFLLAGLLATDRYATVCQQEPRVVCRRVVGAALLFLALFALAITSKEPGIALLAVAPLYLYFARQGAPIPRRAVEIAVLAVPALGVAVLFLLVRFRVLGEVLGGYHVAHSSWDMAKLIANYLPLDLAVPGFSAAVERTLPLYLRLPFFDSSALGYSALAIAAGALGVWIWGRLAGDAGRGGRVARVAARSDQSSRCPTARLLLFALWVFAIFAALFLATKAYDRRLLYPLLPFFALLAGALFDRAAHEMRGRARSGQWSASLLPRCALLVLAATTALALIWQGPLIQRDREWREAGIAARLLTDDLRDGWERLPIGSVVWVVNLAGGFDFDPARRIAYTPRSSTNAPSIPALEAWLDDQLPERRLRVRSLGTFRYREPLREFRHEAAVRRGWLEFDTPLARMELDAPFAELRGFRLRELGDGRMALARTAAPREGPTFVLVVDGSGPIFVSLEQLRVVR